MAHKYIKKIIEIEKTPYGWSENTGRDSKWREERRIYGFDERETWSLDTTFYYWLYERLAMFKEVNCINLDFHKFIINGIEMSQKECIELMMDNCKKLITYNGTDDMFDLKNETLDIWKECIHHMWW